MPGRISSASRGLAAVLALCCAFAGVPVAAQDQPAISTAEARRIGFALIAGGRPDAAVQVAQALLRHDPNDAAALLILARALRALGQTEASLAAARQANGAAATDPERFGAAMELAAGNMALDRPLVAQVWLRRAAQVAPSPDLRQAAINDFRRVGASTPWRVTLQFSVAPSSNVNNGSSQDTIEILGLPFTLSGDAKALSGLEYGASAAVRYRFAGLGGKPAEVGFFGRLQRVQLSSDAKAQAPDLENGDLSYDTAEFSAVQVLQSREGAAFWRLDAVAGRHWYGGAALTTYGRVGAVTSWKTGPRSSATANVSVERQVRHDNAARSAWVTRAGVEHGWRLVSGDVFSLSGGVRTTRSAAVDIDHDAVSVGLGYQIAKPLFDTVAVGFGLDYERRDFAQSLYAAGGRRDDRFLLTASFAVPKADYYGFYPVVTFSAQKVASNITLYDSQDYGVQFALRSSF